MFAGGAPFTIPGMAGHIVVIELAVTVVAEVRPVEESSKGIASVVMAVFLDETNDLIRRSWGPATMIICSGSIEMTLICWSEIGVIENQDPVSDGGKRKCAQVEKGK